MIARTVGALALVLAIGIAFPLAQPEAAADGITVLAPAASAGHDPTARLHGAVEAAMHRHVPGAAGTGWVLHRLDRSEPGIGGDEHIVATGVMTAPAAADTHVRLTGRYDPETGVLSRVSYRLQAPRAAARDDIDVPMPDTAWSVQQAVQQAFSEVLPDDRVVFALDSAQATRVDGGGRRFEGSGIGSWRNGEARFIAFTMTLSAYGELVEFDYGAADEGEDPQDSTFVASN